jgi:hypothetical protein
MSEPDAHADQHWLYAVIFDDLRFCGCGQPEERLALVVEMLRACPWYDGGWRAFSDRLTSAGFEFIADQLTAADLIEHGSSVNGSWLTEKGQRFLSLVEGFDFDNDTGYSCSDCPKQSSDSEKEDDRG